MRWLLIGIVVVLIYVAVTIFTFALMRAASDEDDLMELEDYNEY